MIEVAINEINGIKIIEKANFEGGCSGNTQGITRLVIGMPVAEAIKKLKGIKCGSKKTSCPDQLSAALENALKLMKESDNINNTNNYIKEFEKWLNYEKLDGQIKKELEEICSNDDKEKIKEYFIAPLEFGTAGLRGVMRPGINSMNIYTVRHATQGIANLIKSQNLEKRGVVIAFDSRNNSDMFSKEAAKTLAANGILAYIFDDIRPTPELSFAVRYLKCAAGINITASHNPKEYNGYKAYWEDGAQIPPDYAETVSQAINQTDIFDGVLTCDYNEAVKNNIIKTVGKEIDEAYLQKVIEQSIYPDIIKNISDKSDKSDKDGDFKVLYTPLHGAGYKLIPEVLKRRGLKMKNLLTVPEQMVIDGNFPTVKFPNPEFKEVFDIGIETAKKENCSLLIGTDPDSDRVGIVVRTNNKDNKDNKDNKNNKDNGEYVSLSGNQVGVLLLDYIITARKENGTLPKNACAIKTIVSTELAAKVCEMNDVKIINVLTGFKFIGEKIKQFEETGEYTYIFGYEESYGYLAGTYARDKDAVVASMLIVEMAAYYKSKNMTLYDAMREIYKKYGYYGESVQNIAFPGIDGSEKMRGIMNNLRENSRTPKMLGGYKVVSFRDYKTSQIKNFITGEISDTGLPKSDVLYFDLNNGSKVIIRPSGTEPKIKIYYMLSADNEKSAALQAEKLKSDMAELVRIQDS